MHPLIKSLVEIAKSQVGVREEGGNNLGFAVKQYQKATWLNPGAWPWCAAFMAWLFMKWTVEHRNELCILFGIEDDELAQWRCRDASAFGWIKWAEKHNLKIFREDDDNSVVPELAKAGDIIVFDFSHIGLCIKDQLSFSEPINTVEGNTNGKGERDSVSGDGVWIKNRAPVLARAIIRVL